MSKLTAPVSLPSSPKRRLSLLLATLLVGAVGLVPFFVPTAFADPLDIDNDGVANAIDIDDDGDGIRDAVEAPACYYTQDQITLSVAGSDLNWNANLPYTFALDGNATTYSQLATVNQSLATGATVLEYSLNGFVLIDTLDLTMYNYPLTTATGQMKLQGWDGTGWIDLSTAAPRVKVSAVESFTNTLATTTVVNKLRIVGVSGGTSYARVRETSMTLLSYDPSYNPIGDTCSVDSDGDGLSDSRDLDSDNDTIPDNVEAQSTAGYEAPIGIDSDGNGLDDTYESRPGQGEGLFPVDTDFDGQSDYLDLDSDDDRAFDIKEAGNRIDDANSDGVTDNAVGANGLDNTHEAADDYSDPNGVVNGPTSLPDVQYPGGEVDFRSDLTDVDLDGISNRLDADEDNDGIRNAVECPAVTSSTSDSWFSPTGQVDSSTLETDQGISVTMTNPTDAGNGTFALGAVSTISGSSPNNLVQTVGGLDPPDGTNRALQYVQLTFSEPITSTSFFIGSLDLSVGEKVYFSIGGGYTGVLNFNDGIAPTFTTTGAASVTPSTYVQPSNGEELPGLSAISINGKAIVTVSSATAFTEVYLRIVDSATSSTVTYFQFQGVTNASSPIDTDGDGIADCRDLDSDNDGISDLVESGQDASARDTNNDGIVDTMTDPATGDTDSDGLADIADGDAGGAYVVPVNTDANPVADYLDLDSDGDGIPDTIESRLTAGYVQNDGNVSNNDADEDGVISLFDSNDASGGYGGSFIPPVDTDADGTPDFRDLDSDADGLTDMTESGLTLSGSDANRDGADDALGVTYVDPDGSINDPRSGLANQAGDTTEVGYREIPPPAPAISVTKTASPAGAGVGDTITYTITVTNTGNVDLASVSVDDPLTSDESCPAGPLAVGDSVDCTATYQITQADADLGRVNNTASAIGTDSSGNEGTGQASNVYPVSQTPDFDVVKTGTIRNLDGDGIPQAGDYVDYTITVTNTGDVTLSDIAVTDPKTGAVTCNVTRLAPGEVATCEAVSVLTQADILTGSQQNTASVTAKDPTGGSVTGEGGTTLPVAFTPQLTVTKTPTTNEYVANQLINYTIVVVNSGNVEITDIAIDDPAAPDASCPATSLLPGEQMICTASHLLTQAEFDSGTFSNTATVTGLDPRGGGVSESDTFATPFPYSPSLDITKVGVPVDTDLDGMMEAGETINYTIKVTNTGNATVDNVTVTDPNITNLSCAPTTLPPGAISTCTGSLTLDQDDINAGTIDNSASVTGDDPGGNPVGAGPVSVTTDLPAKPNLTTVKSGVLRDDVVDDDLAQVDETIDYTITVTNSGNVPINNVSVADPLITLGTCTPAAPASLNPGESISCAGTYTLLKADVDRGSVLNVATATGTDINGTDVTDQGSTNTVLPADASMSVVKTGVFNDQNGDSLGQLGETVTFTITVTNTGNLTLNNVAVSDPKVGTPTCDKTQLAPDEVAVCTIVYALTQADLDAGQVDNTATASGLDPTGRSISEPGSTTTDIPTAPQLTVAKSGVMNDENDDGIAQRDETVTYTIVVTNTGSVTVSDLSVSDPKAGTPTCDVTTIAPRELATCTVTYTLTQTDIDSGSVANTATATGKDPQGGDVSDDGSTTTPMTARPGLSVEKTGNPIDSNNDGSVVADETIEYDIVVTNTGNVTISNISVADPTAGTPSCPQTQLAPLASMTCTVTYTVTAADALAGSVNNTATASGTGPSGTPVNGSGTTTTDLPSATALDVTKTGALNDLNGDGKYTAGETITYTITAKNRGSVTLSNVRVTDPKLPDLVCGPVLLGPDASTTCTGVYVLTQADVDNGEVVNTATGTGEDPDGATVSGRGRATTPVPAVPQLTVTKSAAYDTYIEGSVLNYTIVVRNSGNVTMSNIAISDPLTSNESCPATVLAPGEQMECTASYTLTATDLAANSLTNVATVSGRDPSGNPSSATGRATTPFVAAPAMATVKTNDAAGKELKAGDRINYTITVTNVGNVPITDVLVTDPMPPTLVCDGDRFAPGGVITCTGSYTMTQADINAGGIENVANVSGLDPAGRPVTSTGTNTLDVLGSPELTVDKVARHDDANQNGRMDAGEKLVYSITITNTDNVSVTEIAIGDPLTSDEACPVAELLPGEATVCTASYTLQQADIDAGNVVNTATVSGVDPSGGGVEGTDTVDTPIEADPMLTVIKSSSGSGLEVGGVVNYEIRVFNTGNVTVRDINVTDELTTDESCPATQLAPGESMTCTASYTLNQDDVTAGLVRNTATATGADPKGNPVTGTGVAEYPFDANPSYEVLKEGTWIDANGNGIIQVGETVTYKISITNTGNVDLFDLVVTDPMTGAPACASAVVLVGSTVDCYVNYTLQASDLLQDNIVNNASVVASTPQGGTVPGQGTNTLPVPLKGELTVEKSGEHNDTDGDGMAEAGETIDYTILVTNTGNVLLTDVSVSDPLVGAPTCDASSLEPGESTTCTITYTIKQSDVDAGGIDNTATATGTDPRGRTIEGSGSTRTELPADPKPTLAKSGALVDTDKDGKIEAGEAIDYTITVTNDGNVTITDIDVSDPLTDDPECDATTLKPGEVATCTVTYTLTQDDVDAGSVKNTATVSGKDPSGKTVKGEGSRTTPLSLKPSLKVTKSGLPADANGNHRIDVGEKVNYEIVVTNTGNVTVDEIEVSDPLTGPPNCPTTSLAPGASMTCSVTYVLTTADIEAGSVRNTARVSAPGLPGEVAGSTSTVVPKAKPDTPNGLRCQNKTVDVLANDARGLVGSTLRLLDPKTGEPVKKVVVPGEGTWRVVEGKLVFDPEGCFVGTTTPIDYTAKTADGVPVKSTVSVKYRLFPATAGPQDPPAPGLPTTGGLMNGLGAVLTLGLIGGGIAYLARRNEGTLRR